MMQPQTTDETEVAAPEPPDPAPIVLEPTPDDAVFVGAEDAVFTPEDPVPLRTIGNDGMTAKTLVTPAPPAPTPFVTGTEPSLDPAPPENVLETDAVALPDTPPTPAPPVAATQDAEFDWASPEL